MNSLEAIKQLRQYNSVGLCGDKTLFEPIEKDLEALEIIKKYGYKKVFELEEVEDGGYISNREESEFIPKKTFNLLKEVLEDDK